MESGDMIPILRLLCRTTQQRSALQKAFGSLWNAASANASTSSAGGALTQQPIVFTSAGSTEYEGADGSAAQSSTNHVATRFDTEHYASMLKTKEFGLPLLAARCVGSTQVAMREFLLPHISQGFAFMTDLQTSGIGRGSNVWDSPEGSLAVSFCCKLPFSKGIDLPFLQYLVTLSIVESIKSRPELKEADIRIKWPNDVYGQGLKIGGILCQTDTFGGVFNVTIGVGINVSNEKPTISLNNLVSHLLSTPLTREEILAEFFNKFESNYEQFLVDGFHPFIQSYIQNWMRTGQEVTIVEEQREVKVVVRGLTSSGCLLAQDEHGVDFELQPDYNTFDFFKGLIRRKI